MDDFIVLTLGYARTAHRWTNHDISSPFVRLFYIRSGEAVLHLEDTDVHLTAGHMYMLPGYTPHAYECEPGLEFYYLFIYQPELEKASLYDLYDFPYEVNANEGARLLFEHYCMLYPQLNLPSRDAEAFLNHQAYRDYAQAYLRMEAFERMQLHGMVEILLSYFIKHAEPRLIIKDDRILKLIGYISEHVSENITVATLADISCLTESHLVKAFRKELGVTPLQYIIKKRIQHAQTLLLGTEMTVSEVSQSAGFTDSSYFVRLFKRHIGYTPQQYRDRLIG